MAGANGSSRWTDALLDRMRQLGDPVADKPVGAVLERGGLDAVNATMRTLVRVDQPVPEEFPDEIQTYLVETLVLPEWADMRKIKRGQQLFETWGLLIAVCLFCASLPSSYAAAKGVKVLYLTARLDTDARRLPLLCRRIRGYLPGLTRTAEHVRTAFRTLACPTCWWTRCLWWRRNRPPATGA